MDFSEEFPIDSNNSNINSHKSSKISKTSKISKISKISPAKYSIFLGFGIILEAVYIILKYLVQPAGISQIVYSLMFLVANIFLLFGIYYWSLGISKPQMFMFGSIAVILGSLSFLGYILGKSSLFMDLGINLVLLGIFLLFYWILMLFRKKNPENYYYHE